MPDFGYTTSGSSSRATNALMKGSVFVMPENGTLVSGTARIRDASSGDTWRMAIYDATVLTAATLQDQSATSTAPAADNWYTFSTWTGIALVSGTSYFIGVGTNSVAGAEVNHDTGTGYSIVVADINSLTTPTNLSATSDARLYSTYITYTTAGGGTVNLFLGKFGGLFTGKLG